MTEWVTRKTNSDTAALTIKGKTIPKTIVQILENRGYHSADMIERYFAPRLSDLHDPFLLNNMEKAVDRIIMAIRQHEKILVHGDYDVDGITACAFIVQYLTKLGAGIEYYIPHRLEEGYGLSKNAIDYALARKCSLVITVDCGVTAIEEINYAQQQGIDVVVTDHHKPADDLPSGYALINPKLPDSSYPFQELAGVGVAYKLCTALREKHEGMQDVMKEGLDLVALGTVVDMVPLIDENRILAKYGLHMMPKSTNLGMQALLEEAELSKIVTAYHAGFVIGPRINACGRIGDAREALELFLTKNKARAELLAQKLAEANRQRQSIMEQIYEEARGTIEREKRAEDKVIIMANRHWHEGIVGVVASKISDLYHRPTILLCVKEHSAKGSARSIPGFDITEALHHVKDILIKYGGHSQAAGLELKTDDIDLVRKRINAHAQSYSDSVFSRRRMYDMKLNLEDITQELVYFLKYFEPTGIANPQPVFLSEQLEVVGVPRVIGSHHLKCALRNKQCAFDAIAYDQANAILDIQVGTTKIDCLYSVSEDSFTGKKKVVLKIKEMKMTDE